jgi:RNA recognition motif-containing protein
MSPDSAGGFVRRAAPEPNKRALYVGGLDPRVTEDVLRQIFETTGHVQNVKIIPDKNVGAVSINFNVSNPSRIPAPSCVKFSIKRDFTSFSALLP